MMTTLATATGPHRTRGRAGITLTEILISLLIFGVGLVSLATLFPLALLRIKSASDYNRSALLARSAFNDVATRELLKPETFAASWYHAPANRPIGGPAVVPLNPLTHDVTPGTGLLLPPLLPNGLPNPAAAVFRGNTHPAFRIGQDQGSTIQAGPGLPVCYDPMWWAQVRFDQPIANPADARRPAYATEMAVDDQARFGNGDQLVRPGAEGSPTWASYGLRRITNFLPFNSASVERFWPLTFPTADGEPNAFNMPEDIFVSKEDVVWQAESQNSNPIVPDLSGGSVTRDWVFSWMLTGQVSDAGSQTVFEGDVVVFRNRQFGFDRLNGTGRFVPTGEEVLEAVFGYKTLVEADFVNTPLPVYPRGDGRVILLRWPADQPDPQIRIGGWIADATYQRRASFDLASYPPRTSRSPGQRIVWYQVIRKSPIENEIAGTSSEPAQDGYRRMTIMVNTPVKYRTGWINRTTPLIETAVSIHSVVNVFPRTIPINNSRPADSGD